MDASWPNRRQKLRFKLEMVADPWPSHCRGTGSFLGTLELEIVSVGYRGTWRRPTGLIELSNFDAGARHFDRGSNWYSTWRTIGLCLGDSEQLISRRHGESGLLMFHLPGLLLTQLVTVKLHPRRAVRAPEAGQGKPIFAVLFRLGAGDGPQLTRLRRSRRTESARGVLRDRSAPVVADSGQVLHPSSGACRLPARKDHHRPHGRAVDHDNRERRASNCSRQHPPVA